MHLRKRALVWMSGGAALAAAFGATPSGALLPSSGSGAAGAPVPATVRDEVDAPGEFPKTLVEHAKQHIDRTDADDLAWPLDGAVNTSFGAGHDGIDIEAEMGDPIAAAGAGTVVFAGDDGDGYGLRVVLDHGDGIRTLYAHLDSIAVRDGWVDAGEVVGKAGCTGSCSGDHLHFEVRVRARAVDPIPYLREATS